VSGLRVHDRDAFALDHTAQAQHRPRSPFGDEWIDSYHLDACRLRARRERDSGAKREDRPAAVAAQPLTHPEQLSLPASPFRIDIQVQDRERRGESRHALPSARETR